MVKFKKFALVQRKDSHKNSWWSNFEDCQYVVMHDVRVWDETMLIFKVGSDPDDKISVYTDSMESVG